MKGVNVVNIFFPLIDFSFDPMAVKIFEKMVDVLRCSGVTSPLPDVKGQQRFV